MKTLLVAQYFALLIGLELQLSYIFMTQETWLHYISWINMTTYDCYSDILTYTELDSTLGYVTTPYLNKLPSCDNVSLANVLIIYKSPGIPNNKMVVILPLHGAMIRVEHNGGLYYCGLRPPITYGPTPTYVPHWKIYLEYGNYNHPLHDYIPANIRLPHHQLQKEITLSG